MIVPPLLLYRLRYRHDQPTGVVAVLKGAARHAGEVGAVGVPLLTDQATAFRTTGHSQSQGKGDLLRINFNEK